MSRVGTLIYINMGIGVAGVFAISLKIKFMGMERMMERSSL